MNDAIYLMTSSVFFRKDKSLNSSDKLIWNAIKKQGKTCAYFHPGEITSIFLNGKIKLILRGVEILPGRLLVRSTRGMERASYEVARSFKEIGGIVVDSLDSLIFSSGKLLPFINRYTKIFLPKTVFFKKSRDIINEILSKISFPFILKPQNGYSGIGVSLISSQKEFLDYIDSSKENFLIAQEYLDISSEFRVFVIDGRALGVVRKNSKSIAKNASRGAFFEVVDDVEVMNFAEKVAKFEKASILGTDIVRTNDGFLFLIENNRSPNFTEFRKASGIYVEDRILQFLLRAV